MTGRLWAALLLALAAPAAGAAATAKDAAATNTELTSLRARIEALQREVTKSEGERTEAADALQDSERAISEANRKLFELAARRKQADAELAGLRERASATTAAVARQQEMVARLVRQQYMAGPAAPLRLLLSGDDPNVIARRAAYHGYVARARAGVVEGLRRDQAALAALAEQTLQQTAQIAAIQTEELAGRQRLEAEREKRRGVLASVSRQIADQRRAIGTLQNDEKRLARLAESLTRMLVARKPSPAPTPAPRGPTRENVPDASFDGIAFQRLKGRLQLPVRGELAGRFGSPRSDSGLAWRGLFIHSTAGQEVKAVASGLVVFADWLRGFGNLLIIDHGEGYMSLYGNNESLVRRVGDRVRAGDAVATVGSSGGNAQNGLYFELRHQGKPFDPLGWVSN